MHLLVERGQFEFVIVFLQYGLCNFQSLFGKPSELMRVKSANTGTYDFWHTLEQ